PACSVCLPKFAGCCFGSISNALESGTNAPFLPTDLRKQPVEVPMTAPASPAFTASATLKPLGFDPAKLNGLSERLIHSHWENNYGGSVKALAVVKKQLAEALENKDTPPYVYNDLKREHLMRTGSVVLHELYFDNLGGNGKADAAARNALSDAFGAYDTWEIEF